MPCVHQENNGIISCDTNLFREASLIHQVWRWGSFINSLGVEGSCIFFSFSDNTLVSLKIGLETRFFGLKGVF